MYICVYVYMSACMCVCMISHKTVVLYKTDSGINSNPAVSTVDSDAGKCYCHLENGDIGL